jgi:hypothetical protein
MSQTLLGYFDPDFNNISYWFLPSMTIDQIITMSDTPLEDIKTTAKPLLKGKCTLEQFTHAQFLVDNDSKWGVVFLKDCTICHDDTHNITLRKQVKTPKMEKNDN